MQTAKSKTIDSILLSIESEIKKTYRFGRDNIMVRSRTPMLNIFRRGVEVQDYLQTLNLYNRTQDMEARNQGCVYPDWQGNQKDSH